MKKLLSFMVVALLMAAQATAQTVFATLIHEGTLSSFTGADGLSQAMTAAADGDFITLSSGSFNGCNITKAITLRGAGMEADELGRQTLITGDIFITVSGGKNKTVSFEGFSMPSKNLLVSDTIGTVYLNKCVIGTYDIEHTRDNDVKNSIITNCKIKKVDYGTSTNYYFKMTGGKKFYAYNSFILEISLESDVQESRYDNCVIGGNTTYGNYYDCIFLGQLNGYKVVDHCVSSSSLNGSSASNNYQVEDVKTIFNNYDENATWHTRDLTLTDEAKATYLGSDGTEVGIYGGSQPFSPWLDRPFIKRLNVAPKSTREGKLSVDIEVGETE